MPLVLQAVEELACPLFILNSFAMIQHTLAIPTEKRDGWLEHLVGQRPGSDQHVGEPVLCSGEDVDLLHCGRAQHAIQRMQSPDNRNTIADGFRKAGSGQLLSVLQLCGQTKSTALSCELGGLAAA